MQPLSTLPAAVRREIRGVFTDIDDTLTSSGRLTAQAYAALENLLAAGLRVVPVTGRPAGWCDHIARFWPVSAVVGENGAFFFYHDRAHRKLHKRYVQSVAQREQARKRLASLREQVLRAVPGAGVASDQAYRESDLAIDYCEDVAPLAAEQVQEIVRLAQAAGAQAKISSIHVNAWFGNFDKLSTTRRLVHECFGEDLDSVKEHYVFVGDSPNDAPMFEYFPLSVGVANVRKFADQLAHAPRYVTQAHSGAGFSELAELLLADHTAHG